jgi:MoaA/NifB/PqqE/SkfB family radical SAM enzyme
MDSNPANAPHTVDLNLLGKCNLRCPFCWGPPHNQGALLSGEQWKQIIDKLADSGTRAIVLTGGEPLLRADLVDICDAAKARQLRVTLSTNGIALPAVGSRILPLIDELGLPLDGADKATNNALRRSRGKLNHYRSFLKAVDFAKRYPKIEITVRTIVSRQNAAHVIDIGRKLRELKIAKLRWKLYQFVPISYGRDVSRIFSIEMGCFQAVVDEARRAYPDLDIDKLDHDGRNGRYLHILPNGDAMTPTCTHEELLLGNVLEDFDSVLSNLVGRVDLAQNLCHGRPRHSDRADLAIEVHGRVDRPHLSQMLSIETLQMQPPAVPPAR